jgi:DegV family protein with EDD domain
MPNVRVVADSGCDLPEDVVTEQHITIVPLTIRFGEEEFGDIGVKEFWEKCRQSPALPETAAPSPGAFATAFRQLAAQGADGVVCINLSSRLSATIQSAQAAAREVADLIPVRVIDSLSVSLGQGLQIMAAAGQAEEGKGLDEVADCATAMVPRMRVFAVLDTLENLKKGGRIGGAQALVGSMLSIKPVIQVKEGAVEQESRQRTRSRSLQYLVDKLAEAQKKGDIERIAIMHGDAADIDQFVDMVMRVIGSHRPIVGWVGPVIGAHAGAGVIGVGWQAPGP